MRPPAAPSPEPVAELMRSLPERLRPGAFPEWRAVVHFRLSRCPNPLWTVRIEGGRCTVAEGLAGVPDCLVESSGATLLGIAAGTLNPQAAFLLRRVKVSRPGLLLKFLEAFSWPDRGDAARRPSHASPSNQPSPPEAKASLPLGGVTVVDCTRMLPGAVLARHLLELGARLIKVEDAAGDPMRHAPPFVDGIGAGFAAFYRGAESVILDLRSAAGQATLRALARRADVFIEGFRPGTLQRWGVGLAELRASNPRLVTCSLTGWGAADDRPAHDLNVTAASGLLSLLAGPGLPKLLLADVAAGMQAATAILAALLARGRGAQGAHIDQSLAAAVRPFLLWPAADRAAGSDGVIATHLAGACPAYRRYRCGDGGELAVAAVEPKFWTAWVEMLGLPELDGAGLETGEKGERAAAEVAAVLGRAPRSHWLAMAANAGVPVSPVLTLAEVAAEGATPLLAGLAAAPAAPPPQLGEHSAAVLAELGLTSAVQSLQDNDLHAHSK